MRGICLMMAMALGALGCVSCGGGGSIAASSYNPGYGPFDADGNYVEAWADKPAKKHWWARKPAPKPEDPPAKTAKTAKKKPEPLVAKTSPPPAKPTRSSSRPGRYRPGPSRPTAVSSRAAKPKPQPVAAAPKPKSKPKPRPVASTPKPKPKPRPVASTPKPKPRPVAAAKPKPVKVTPKKPAPRKHLVKKGDTLYGLSRKYGTSVSSIQRANGLKGTTIQLGKTLKIPR